MLHVEDMENASEPVRDIMLYIEDNQKAIAGVDEGEIAYIIFTLLACIYHVEDQNRAKKLIAAVATLFMFIDDMEVLK